MPELQPRPPLPGRCRAAGCRTSTLPSSRHASLQAAEWLRLQSAVFGEILDLEDDADAAGLAGVWQQTFAGAANATLVQHLVAALAAPPA